VITVRRADGIVIATLDAGQGAALAAYKRGRSEFLTVPAADAVQLPAVVTKPPDFDPAKRYPVLIYVYGGPHVQNVRNAWGGTRGLWHQMMAAQGYLVWSLDNRGAWGRGHAWETPIHKRMGSRELADQLAGVAWLKTQPWVDPARIGIWGWSYGGYMTLFALCNAPGKLKMGVAVAPVTDWKDYDTIYTERYMELPAGNADGYRDASPVNQASKLADPLLLVHGTADDNVHMQNSVHMLDALVKATRPVEFMLYPRKNHGILGKDARTHLFEKITAFVKEHL
jgi:dipeptidyl-peptidase-4